MNLKTLGRNLSFRKVNSLIFIVLLLAAVGLTDLILFSNWRESAEQNAILLASDINEEMYNQIDAFIDVPRQVNNTNRTILESGIVDIGNEAEREKFFVGILGSLDSSIYSFSFGSASGEYYGARRDPAGTLQIMRNNAATGGNSWYYAVNSDRTAGELTVQAGPFDPRTRDWYKVAEQSGQPMFSPIYKHFVMEDLTVSAATPIYDPAGRLEGILGTHVVLHSINDYLDQIIGDRGGYAAIVERDSGRLVANSFGSLNFVTVGQGQIRRFTLPEAGNPMLSEALMRYQTGNESRIRLQGSKGDHFVRMTGFTRDGLDWVVISAVPAGLFMADFDRSIKLALLLTLLAIAIAIIIYTMITDRFLKPVDNLIDATERFTRGDLSQRVPVARNDEIGRISLAFNNMADTLSRLVDNLEETVRSRTRELEASNESLRQADRNKNEFINSLSHELRNPLAAIVAGLSVLEMAKEPEKQARARDIIKRQSAQLSHLVDDLLDVTRITRNKIDLRKARVNIGEVALRAAEGQRALFDDKNIHLKIDIQDNDLYMQADPVRLTQIIGNLLHNSYKFTEPGGSTRMTVQRHSAEEALISIRDNGIGINPEFLGELFDPFTQADMSLDRHHGGLGLGLSIVKGIAELHGGRVRVESAGLGHGAEFFIYLPLEGETELPEPVEAADDAHSTGAPQPSDAEGPAGTVL